MYRFAFLLLLSPLCISAPLEEIVITGLKKREAVPLQSTPISATVHASNITTLEDLNFISPNVTLDSVGTFKGAQNFSIRGLGVNSSIPSLDPAVGIFQDGVYLGTVYGGVMDVSNLESIEVLRGPQGLLFGRNVTGGAILTRSKRPGDELDIWAKFGVETGAQYRGNLAVSGPLSDTIKAGISGYYKNDNGFFDNLAGGDDIGDEETYIIKPIVSYSTNNLQATFIYEHGDITGDGTAPQRTDSTDAVEVNIDNAGLTDIEWNQATAEIKLDVFAGTLTNIFGWRQLDQLSETDIDSSPLSLFNALVTVEQEQISNELRYTGNITDDWEITAGVYYFSQSVEYREARDIAFSTVQIAAGGEQDHQTAGLFINNDYQLNKLVFSAGIRYTYENKDADISRFGLCNFTTLSCASDFSDERSWSNLSPKLGLAYYRENMMLYGHWSRGFRSGGYNLRSSLPNIFPPGPTDKEKQDAFELGLKTQISNNLAVNIAGFVNLIEDIQREIVLVNPVFGVVQSVENAADATIYGVELDAYGNIGKLGFSTHIGYLKSEYDNIIFDISGDGIINDADEDLRIPRIPKWTASVNAEYKQPLLNGELSIQADYRYRDDAAFTEDNTVTLPSFETINAAISYTQANWTVRGYGKNLTDEAIIHANVPLPFGPAAPRFSPLQKGRRVGVELSYQY